MEPLEREKPEMKRQTSSDGEKKEVRRPMNAFLIFCKRHRSMVRDKNPDLDNRCVTKILGDLWANLRDDDKQQYTSLAKQYKDAFMKANPDYKWHNPDKSNSTPAKMTTRPTNARVVRTSAQVAISGAITPGKLADPAKMGGLNLLLMAGQQSSAASTASPFLCSLATPLPVSSPSLAAVSAPHLIQQRPALPLLATSVPLRASSATSTPTSTPLLAASMPLRPSSTTSAPSPSPILAMSLAGAPAAMIRSSISSMSAFPAASPSASLPPPSSFPLPPPPSKAPPASLESAATAPPSIKTSCSLLDLAEICGNELQLSVEAGSGRGGGARRSHSTVQLNIPRVVPRQIARARPRLPASSTERGSPPVSQESGQGPACLSPPPPSSPLLTASLQSCTSPPHSSLTASPTPTPTPKSTPTSKSTPTPKSVSSPNSSLASTGASTPNPAVHCTTLAGCLADASREASLQRKARAGNSSSKALPAGLSMTGGSAGSVKSGSVALQPGSVGVKSESLESRSEGVAGGVAVKLEPGAMKAEAAGPWAEPWTKSESGAAKPEPGGCPPESESSGLLGSRAYTCGKRIFDSIIDKLYSHPSFKPVAVETGASSQTALPGDSARGVGGRPGSKGGGEKARGGKDPPGNRRPRNAAAARASQKTSPNGAVPPPSPASADWGAGKTAASEEPFAPDFSDCDRPIPMFSQWKQEMAKLSSGDAAVTSHPWPGKSPVAASPGERTAEEEAVTKLLTEMEKTGGQSDRPGARKQSALSPPGKRQACSPPPDKCQANSLHPSTCHVDGPPPCKRPTDSPPPCNRHMDNPPPCKDSTDTHPPCKDSTDSLPPGKSPVDNAVVCKRQVDSPPGGEGDSRPPCEGVGLLQEGGELAGLGGERDAGASLDAGGGGSGSRPTRKSRRRNRGQRYQELINEGIIQPCKARLAAMRAQSSGEQVYLSDEVSRESAEDMEAVEAGGGAQSGQTEECWPRSHTGLAASSGDITEEGSKYKTGDFDLEAHIATLPPCPLEPVSKSARRASSGSRPHTSREEVGRTGAVAAPPLTGSRKRKARRHQILRWPPGSLARSLSLSLAEHTDVLPARDRSLSESDVGPAKKGKPSEPGLAPCMESEPHTGHCSADPCAVDTHSATVGTHSATVETDSATVETDSATVDTHSTTVGPSLSVQEAKSSLLAASPAAETSSAMQVTGVDTIQSHTASLQTEPGSVTPVSAREIQHSTSLVSQEKGEVGKISGAESETCQKKSDSQSLPPPGSGAELEQGPKPSLPRPQPQLESPAVWSESTPPSHPAPTSTVSAASSELLPASSKTASSKTASSQTATPPPGSSLQPPQPTTSQPRSSALEPAVQACRPCVEPGAGSQSSLPLSSWQPASRLPQSLSDSSAVGAVPGCQPAGGWQTPRPQSFLGGVSQPWGGVADPSQAPSSSEVAGLQAAREAECVFSSSQSASAMAVCTSSRLLQQTAPVCGGGGGPSPSEGLLQVDTPLAKKPAGELDGHGQRQSVTSDPSENSQQVQVSGRDVWDEKPLVGRGRWEDGNGSESGRTRTSVCETGRSVPGGAGELMAGGVLASSQACQDGADGDSVPGGLESSGHAPLELADSPEAERRGPGVDAMRAGATSWTGTLLSSRPPPLTSDLPGIPTSTSDLPALSASPISEMPALSASPGVTVATSLVPIGGAETSTGSPLHSQAGMQGSPAKVGFVHS